MISYYDIHRQKHVFFCFLYLPQKILCNIYVKIYFEKNILNTFQNFFYFRLFLKKCLVKAENEKNMHNKVEHTVCICITNFSIFPKFKGQNRKNLVI